MIKTRMKDHNCGELNLSNVGEEITLSGWVSTIRDLGGILFIEILGQCEKVGAHAMNILEALQDPSILFAGQKIAKGKTIA